MRIPIISKCKRCGNERKHYAKGMCVACYQNDKRVSNQFVISRDRFIKIICDIYDKHKDKNSLLNFKNDIVDVVENKRVKIKGEK